MNHARISMIQIREAICADAAAIARVHVDSWRTTYRGWLPDEFLARMAYAPRERQWKHALCGENGAVAAFVAVTATGGVVGFASCGASRSPDLPYQGELYGIYLLREFQGQGIGRTLVQHVIECLIEQDLPSMLLWVMANNPARHFYERLGGGYAGVKFEEIGGKLIEEWAYGWNDLYGTLELIQGTAG